MEFDDRDLADLLAAKRRLESPSFTAKLSDLVGQPVEAGLRMVPEPLNQHLDSLAQVALMQGLNIAVRTMDETRSPSSSRDRFHKLLSAGSGALGGSLGLWALAIELPVSTSLILRSIADIARSEGHDISSWETRLSCLEVFALGGRSDRDNAAESGYWIVRASLSKMVSDAARYITQRGVIVEGAPPIVRLIAAIAPRLGVNLSAQVTVKALPIVSALTGAGVNVLFMNHFQEMARGHFAVKRSEQIYGSDIVEQQYKSLLP